MNSEMNQLEALKTWVLVELPPNKTAIKGKWVYKIKTDKDGKIAKYKARWVVKGFTQEYGVNYLETFANTVKPEVIRILLYLATYQDYIIVQWDIKNAFVHADIDKEIYVKQPTGYTQKMSQNSPITSQNQIVCKLKKALYGLKQSPRL